TFPWEYCGMTSYHAYFSVHTRPRARTIRSTRGPARALRGPHPTLPGRRQQGSLAGKGAPGAATGPAPRTAQAAPHARRLARLRIRGRAGAAGPLPLGLVPRPGPFQEERLGLFLRHPLARQVAGRPEQAVVPPRPLGEPPIQERPGRWAQGGGAATISS